MPRSYKDALTGNKQATKQGAESTNNIPNKNSKKNFKTTNNPYDILNPLEARTVYGKKLISNEGQKDAQSGLVTEEGTPIKTGTPPSTPEAPSQKITNPITEELNLGGAWVLLPETTPNQR